MHLLLFCAVLITIFLCLWKSSKKEKECKGLQPLPGPFALPVIGHLHLIGSKSLHIVLKELSELYGTVFRLRLGSREAVVLSDRDALYEAFVKKAKDFAGRPDLPTFKYTRHGRTGISLSTVSKENSSNRKKAVRAIHKVLSQSLSLNKLLVTESSKMIQLIDEYAKKQTPFYPLEHFEKIIPSLFILMMFGENVSYDDSELLNIVSSYRKWFQAAEADNPADFFPFLSYLPNKRLSTISESGKAFEKFSMKRIKKLQTKNYYNNNNNNNNNDDDDECNGNDLLFNSLLKHLIDESNIINEDDEKEVAKVVSDLVGGGFDTSVAVLSWALLYLANSPDVFQKCRNEITEATGKDPVTLDIKHKCPYFCATLHEVYRLTTVASTGLVHCTTTDTSVKGYFIPKDTIVTANLWQINNCPKRWENPEKLMPERFLDESGQLKREAVKDIATFSAGLRRCPAQDIAFCMNFSILGTFIKQYDLTLTQSPKDMLPLRGVTAKPKPYLIRVVKNTFTMSC